MSGKGTPATKVLDEAGVSYRVHEYTHDAHVSNFGLEAADALGTNAALVHKTLLAVVDRNGRPEHIVGVVPADSQLDLKALAAAVGAKKAEMARPADAERITGYVVGGISPLGQRKLLITVIDEDASMYDAIFVSGGRRGLSVEIHGPTLATLIGASFAPIASLNQKRQRPPFGVNQLALKQWADET